MEQFVTSNVIPFLSCDGAHGLDHFIAVRNHAILAVANREDLTAEQKESIIVAAFLHDVDDVKLTNNKKPLYHNSWLEYTIDELQLSNKDEIIKMVDLVSCSKWGDRKDSISPDWYYIPRYCDRLEAIGKGGVARCIDFSLSRNRPMSLPETKIARSLEELAEIVTPERYDSYTIGSKGVYPVTTLDHFYDKLLHIKLPSWLENEYLRGEFESKRYYKEEWVIGYWNLFQGAD